MGTYGVTHIKCNQKTIPFSDSYDAYASGMGLNNALAIKFMSNKLLIQLFSQFTAYPALSQSEIAQGISPEIYDDENTSPASLRVINHLKQQLTEDCLESNSPEFRFWLHNMDHNNFYTTSMCGAPVIMGLNKAIHYGRDYYDEECYYVVDLDNQKYFIKSFFNSEIFFTFEQIRSLSVQQINILFNSLTDIQNIEEMATKFKFTQHFAFEEPYPQDNIDNIILMLLSGEYQLSEEYIKYEKELMDNFLSEKTNKVLFSTEDEILSDVSSTKWKNLSLNFSQTLQLSAILQLFIYHLPSVKELIIKHTRIQPYDNQVPFVFNNDILFNPEQFFNTTIFSPLTKSYNSLKNGKILDCYQEIIAKYISPYYSSISKSSSYKVNNDELLNMMTFVNFSEMQQLGMEIFSENKQKYFKSGHPHTLLFLDKKDLRSFYSEIKMEQSFFAWFAYSLLTFDEELFNKSIVPTMDLLNELEAKSTESFQDALCVIINAMSLSNIFISELKQLSEQYLLSFDNQSRISEFQSMVKNSLLMQKISPHLSRSDTSYLLNYL